MEDGARLRRARSAARRSTASPIWLGFCALFFARARRPAPAALAAQPRPARAALVLGLALVLQPRRHLHERAARLPAARLPARPHGLDRRGADGSRRRRRPSGRSGCSPRRRSSRPASGSASTSSASNVIDVGYSGVIGAERIAHGQSPYGHFPVEGDAEGVRPGRRRRRDPRAHPDERPLRVGEPAGRHLRPGRLRGLPPRLPDLRLERASGTTCRPRTSRSIAVRPALRCSGSRSSGCASAATRLAVTLAFAWAAYPFTQYVSSSNTNDALPPLFLIWGFWLVTSPWARGAVVALVRRGRSSRRCCSRRSGPRTRTRSAPARRSSLFVGGFVAGDARRVLGPPARAEPAPRGARLLGPHARLADRPRLAVLDLGLAAVPRRAFPTCTSLQRVLEVAARRRRDRVATSCRAASRRSSSPRSRPRC